MSYFHDYQNSNDNADDYNAFNTMFVVCHACARAWEVLVPNDDDEGDWAQCAHCGRQHTVEECLATVVNDNGDGREAEG